MPPWLRRWLEPIGWPTFLLAGAVWLLVSRWVADPLFNYMCTGPVILVVLLWLPLGLLIATRTMARKALLSRYRRSVTRFGSESWQLTWIVIAFGLLHASTITDVPTRLWFLPFRASFESAAAEMRAATPEAAWYGNGPMPSQMRWIGVWHVRVEGVLGEPGVIAFYTDSYRLPGGGSGFVHVNGRDKMIGYNQGADALIVGDWYYFTTD